MNILTDFREHKMNEEIPQKSLRKNIHLLKSMILDLLHFSAFLLFLVEHLEREYKDNILTYYAARTEALPKWNHLTKQEREEFKKMAGKKSEYIRTTIELVRKRDKVIAKMKADEIERVKVLVKKFVRKSIEDTKGK